MASQAAIPLSPAPTGLQALVLRSLRGLVYTAAPTGAVQIKSGSISSGRLLLRSGPAVTGLKLPPGFPGHLEIMLSEGSLCHCGQS